MAHLEPWLAVGVLLSTAATDAVYVMFNAAVSSQRRVPAATWSSVWYLLSAVCGDQLYEELGVCVLCGGGVMDWGVWVDDAVAQGQGCGQGKGCVGFACDPILCRGLRARLRSFWPQEIDGWRRGLE